MEETVMIGTQTLDGCEVHPDEKVTLCCTEHGTKCCPVCFEPDQRECNKKVNFPPAIQDSRKSKEFEAFQEDMKILRRKYEATRVTIKEEIRKVAVTKRHIIKDINRYKRELVSRLEELEKQSFDMVNERYKQITQNMEAVSDKIDQCLLQIDMDLSNTESNSESLLEMRKRRVKTLREELGKVATNIGGFEGLSICLDRGIKTSLDNAKGLTDINLPCQMNLEGNIDIKFESDFETSGISDICSLPDGTVVLTDLSNDCIKRLDESYGKKELMQLDGGPLGICATKYGEMAVTLRELQSVQFVDYTGTRMTLTKSFRTDCSCNYISCIDEELFITCEGGDGDSGPGHVRKYNMAGNLLLTIENDDMGRRLFTTPLHITANADKTKLFITDLNNKVIIIDKTGKKLNRYQNTLLASAFGISALPNQNTFVSSVDSHNVQQFDDKCRYVGTVLSKANGLDNPVCIAYNASRKHLIVSMDDADTLLVFGVTFN